MSTNKKNRIKKVLIGVFATLVLTLVGLYLYDKNVVEPTRIIDRCFQFTEVAGGSDYMQSVVIKITGQESTNGAYIFSLVRAAEPKSFEDYVAKSILESGAARLDAGRFREFFKRTNCN